jgi:hypothetical protein
MRGQRGHEPVLTVTWQAVSGEHGSVSQILDRNFPPICLSVLTLDADASPINHHPQSGIVPFSWSCSYD